MDKDCAKKSKERVTSKKSLIQELEVSIMIGNGKIQRRCGQNAVRRLADVGGEETVLNFCWQNNLFCA